MKMKPIALAVAGVAAATLLSAPVFAAKVSLGDKALDAVSGKSNAYQFSSSNVGTVSLASDASANIQFDWYQWEDFHNTDGSLNKGANDQSGSASLVQQNVGGLANALIWGSAGQNVLDNAEGTNAGGIASSQVNMSYGVFAGGGF